jgi:DNA polymerase-3 subunit gamma/tau
MSYQVLARKWRPGNFKEVAGQAHVLKSLISALENQRLHHAYLFTGTRGVGKTTLARILAKCLNCDLGVTSEPCGECSACSAISEGNFIDLIEVDAASRTKVEDTRDLLDNVQYTPSVGRYKVYLIDEVHMLSNHSFNALLKTLEEPPPHVKFLFATTDPQKLPVTILSRCLQLNLKNINPQIVTDYLISVLNKENIKYEEAALWQIAEAAAGSMRDALTLVDQAISYCQGEIKANGVVDMLGIPDEQQVYEIINALAKKDVDAALSVIQKISQYTPDYNQILSSLLAKLHRIAIAQVLERAVDNSFGDREQVLELACLFSAEDVQLYYQIGLNGREDLHLATDLRSAFEMLLIRMMVFSPSSTQLLEEQAAASGATGGEEEASDALKTATDDSEGLKKKVKLKNTGQPPVISTPVLSPETLTHVLWLKVVPEFKVSGITENLLANTAFSSASSDVINLILDQTQSAMYSQDQDSKIEQVFNEYFGKPVSVNISISVPDEETPSSLRLRLRNESQIELVAQFEGDENVQELVKHFSGSVAKDSILPVDERGKE